MNRPLLKLHLLDILRNSICLVAPRFLAALNPNFSAICPHITSKFGFKAAQKSSALPSKASYARSLFAKTVFFGNCDTGFFGNMSPYCRKILYRSCTKTISFFKQSKFQKRSNIKAIVAYEGTGYFGWQKTRMGPSIEEALEEAIFAVTGERPKIQAASRTDRGVHAQGQVINVHLPPQDINSFHAACNEVLPDSIRILEMHQMPDDFHPTLSAHKKEYRYYVCTSAIQLPIYRHVSWHYPGTLCLFAMEKKAHEFIGTKDFSELAGRRETRKDFVCHIDDCTCHVLPEGRLCITVTGNRFLYKMVRNLVGRIVYAGKGTAGRMCAPAHGLHLHRVFYAASHH